MQGSKVDFIRTRKQNKRFDDGVTKQGNTKKGGYQKDKRHAQKEQH